MQMNFHELLMDALLSFSDLARGNLLLLQTRREKASCVADVIQVKSEAECD